MQIDKLDWCINLHEYPDTDPLKQKFIEWYIKRPNGENYLKLHYAHYFGLDDGCISWWSKIRVAPRMITLQQWDELIKN